MIWILVGVGGALGSMARHGVNHLIQSRLSAFPFGIFTINVVGSVAIGVVAGLVASGRWSDVDCDDRCERIENRLRHFDRELAHRVAVHLRRALPARYP